MKKRTLRTLSMLHLPTRRVASLLVAGLLALAGTALAGSRIEDFTTTTYRDSATTADWDTTGGTLGLPAFSLDPVATLATDGSPEEIVVQGNLLYSASRSRFNVIDIANPESPVVLSTSTFSAKDVVVDGDYAYIADLTGFRVVDIVNPFSPTSLALVGVGAQVYGVAIEGQVCYLAARNAGLVAFDVSVPGTPTVLGSRITPQAYAVDVAGDIAYVADQTGVYVLDVSDPSNPDSIGVYPLGTGCNDVLVDGDRLYVAALAGDLVVLDISDPTSPTFLGSLSLPGISQELAISGSRLYVGMYANGVASVDITDPSNPVLIDSENFSSFTYGVVPDGEYLYTANLANGVQVLRRNHVISNLVGTPSTTVVADAPNDLEVAGGLAFVSSDAAMEIHEILPSGDVNPAVLGSFAQPARGMDLEGSLAYVASLGAGVRVVDVSDPTLPVEIGSTPTGTFALDVKVVGNLAYVADFDSGLVVVDVTDPTNPSIVGSLVLPNFPTQVVVQGLVAWVACGSNGVQVIDISDPTSPALLASIPGDAYCLAVAGPRLYVGTGSGTVLRIYNVFNPATPALMGNVPGTGLATRLAIDGNQLFLANSDATVGLQLIDITFGGTPFLVASRNLPNSPTVIRLHGQRAYLGDLASNVTTLRVFQDDWVVTGNLGLSTEVDSYDEVISSIRLTTTQGSQIDWEVSANGGVNWQAITADNNWNALLVSGNDLRWRSTHTYVGTNAPVTDLALEWLYPFGDVTRIVDVPNDQGGRVYVEFQRSVLDDAAEASTPISQYSVYREVTDPLPVTSGPILASAAERIEGVVIPDDVSSRWIDGALYVEGPMAPLATGFPAGTWVLVASVPAVQTETYLVEVTTDADSSDTGSNDDTFFVLAHTTTPSLYYRSPNAIGHSVDNIAPGAPQNLAATYNQGDILLSWDAAPEQDFQYHRIYRSTDPGFVPGPGTLVHETATTSWTDAPANPGGVYYKVTTLDHAGNESAPAALNSVTAVGGGNGAPGFALRGAMPNPLSASTSIAFELPAESWVSLDVYDVTGRRVRSLASESIVAGEHTIGWDGTDESGSRVAAGVYLYRIQAGDYRATGRMVVIR